ncbi:hypothetical protein EVAR_36238_1 [Eumeta japonica]|uniref:Uncharacterized protein n=1 Tax=Eumeta variegata TaxID=151549 RepID=A0A4C1WZQ3_EUMVA|nr:hypothetical protein EVAR_36238_1 [Eumeta japonica]
MVMYTRPKLHAVTEQSSSHSRSTCVVVPSLAGRLSVLSCESSSRPTTKLLLLPNPETEPVWWINDSSRGIRKTCTYVYLCEKYSACKLAGAN